MSQEIFYATFDIRWSDIDANRHLANSAYINFMSATRMKYLEQAGFGNREFETMKIGPVIFYEHIYYYREVFSGKPIRVSLELGGASEDGMIFKFIHNFYDYKGRHLAHGEMMGCWMDLVTRKMIALPQEAMPILEKANRTSTYKILTKEDTRSHGRIPKDLL